MRWIGPARGSLNQEHPPSTPGSIEWTATRSVCCVEPVMLRDHITELYLPTSSCGGTEAQACAYTAVAPLSYRLVPPVFSGGIFAGVCWKASRVGERLSPYVGAALLLMAGRVLFVSD